MLQGRCKGCEIAERTIGALVVAGVGNGAYWLASGHVRTLEPLRIAPDAVFHKRRHSALVGSGLDVWLTRTGIRRLIVSGIRTEQCCETTTRHASDLGYAVDYVGEATLTFAMTDADGRLWSAEEIRARTELVLVDTNARTASFLALRVHDRDSARAAESPFPTRGSQAA